MRQRKVGRPSPDGIKAVLSGGSSRMYDETHMAEASKEAVYIIDDDERCHLYGPSSSAKDAGNARHGQPSTLTWPPRSVGPALHKELGARAPNRECGFPGH